MVQPQVAATLWADRPRPPAPRLHHVGIQTNDLANSLAWYQDFFGTAETWSLATFSATTVSRLPGIHRLTEVVLGQIRIHLFERPGQSALAPGESATSVQHVCLSVDSLQELADWRERWLACYRSGRYAFAFTDQPTEVVVDDDGIQSFYAYDVNGLEFEFTFVPSGVS